MITVNIHNHCCGNGTKEATKLIKELKKNGIDAGYKLIHNDAKFMSNNKITKEDLKKRTFIEVNKLVFPVHFVDNKHLMSQIIKNIKK